MHAIEGLSQQQRACNALSQYLDKANIRGQATHSTQSSFSSIMPTGIDGETGTQLGDPTGGTTIPMQLQCSALAAIGRELKLGCMCMQSSNMYKEKHARSRAANGCTVSTLQCTTKPDHARGYVYTCELRATRSPRTAGGVEAGTGLEPLPRTNPAAGRTIQWGAHACCLSKGTSTRFRCDQMAFRTDGSTGCSQNNVPIPWSSSRSTHPPGTSDGGKALAEWRHTRCRGE